jgi:hypothetical protein
MTDVPRAEDRDIQQTDAQEFRRPGRGLTRRSGCLRIQTMSAPPGRDAFEGGGAVAQAEGGLRPCGYR